LTSSKFAFLLDLFSQIIALSSDFSSFPKNLRFFGSPNPWFEEKFLKSWISVTLA